MFLLVQKFNFNFSPLLNWIVEKKGVGEVFKQPWSLHGSIKEFNWFSINDTEAHISRNGKLLSNNSPADDLSLSDLY